MLFLPLLLLACPKPEGSGPPVELGPPVLPAPEGAVYTRGQGEPRDALVRWAVAPPPAAKGMEAPAPLPYDEVLSGAAAGAGLAWETLGGLDLPAVRWAAMRAGWPYPIQSWSWDLGPAEAVDLTWLAELRARVQPGQVVGLARVRNPQGDVWVALFSTPTAPLPAFEREYSVGDTLSIPPPEGAAWSLRAASPGLALVSGDSLALTEAGEWVLDVVGPTGALFARVPLYVGERTPEDGPMNELSAPPTDEGAALREALALVNELRSLVDAPPVTVEPLLAAVARKEVARRAEGGLPPTDIEARVRAAGFPEGPVGEVHCRAQSVGECMDGLYWSTDPRRVLLDPKLDAVGAAVVLTDGDVRVVLDFGRR